MLQPTVKYKTDKVKVKFIFKGPVKTWSEVHWSSSAGAAAVKAVLPAAVALAKLRCALLAGDCRMIRVETSCPNVPRNTARDSTVSTIPSVYVAESTGRDSLRVLMRGGTTSRASMYMGGIPDHVIESEEYVPKNSADFDANLKTFLNALKGGAWGFMGRQTGPNDAPRVRVLQVRNTVAALNVVKVTTRTPHMMVNGPYVTCRVGGVVGADKLHPVNQIWKVGVVDDRTFILQGFPFQTAEFQLQNSGFAQKMLNDFVAYTGWNLKDPDTRERGVRTANPPARRKLKRTLGY